MVLLFFCVLGACWRRVRCRVSIRAAALIFVIVSYGYEHTACVSNDIYRTLGPELVHQRPNDLNADPCGIADLTVRG